MDADAQGSKCCAHVCRSTTGHKIWVARRCGVAFELSGSSVSSPEICATTSHQPEEAFLAPLTSLAYEATNATLKCRCCGARMCTLACPGCFSPPIGPPLAIVKR